MLKSLLASVALLAGAHAGLACTAVDILAADKTMIAGRTMEWAFDMKWTLVGQPAGTELTLTAPPDTGLPAKTVKTTYGVMGISAEIFPGGAIIEGQNTAGLGMSGNFLPGFTEYQTVTKDDTEYVSVLGFGAWALGTHATVAELREALPKIKVWADSSLPSGPTPPDIHVVFTDRTGDGIVVEFVNGEVQIHDNVAHVLTNAPTYDWHLTNARNYLSLSTVGVPEITLGTANVTAIGQGGGMMGLPGDYTPPSRFIRAAFLRHHITPPATGAEAIQAVDHILNTVDIPLGIAQSKDGDQVVSDYTQWVAIKDLTNNRLLISDYAHRTSFVSIDLDKALASGKAGGVLVTDLPYPDGAVDATEVFAK
ncbi:choloylglycine hydrolase family protein [Neotabrizicola shimadae]|uniref:Choloylglycine hydrolase family protein n=1 Tax=Neotabrizicola shimadae TaxID=2807096 RepID=A0A8G0ZS02_9RHOB|nr:choloylglycine hydrolase family protein [Neotabrizicola shimadae]QYZ70351.1 choloylglycine hydrolase family protein [Neotabrizicola shimadae]